MAFVLTRRVVVVPAAVNTVYRSASSRVPETASTAEIGEELDGDVVAIVRSFASIPG